MVHEGLDALTRRLMIFDLQYKVTHINIVSITVSDAQLCIIVAVKDIRPFGPKVCSIVIL